MRLGKQAKHLVPCHAIPSSFLVCHDREEFPQTNGNSVAQLLCFSNFCSPTMNLSPLYTLTHPILFFFLPEMRSQVAHTCFELTI